MTSKSKILSSFQNNLSSRFINESKVLFYDFSKLINQNNFEFFKTILTNMTKEIAFVDEIFGENAQSKSIIISTLYLVDYSFYKIYFKGSFNLEEPIISKIYICACLMIILKLENPDLLNIYKEYIIDNKIELNSIILYESIILHIMSWNIHLINPFELISLTKEKIFKDTDLQDNKEFFDEYSYYFLRVSMESLEILVNFNFADIVDSCLNLCVEYCQQNVFSNDSKLNLEFSNNKNCAGFNNIIFNIINDKEIA